MPKIPTYEQQTTPQGALVINNDYGNNAVGLAAIAAGVRSVANAVQYKAEQDDVANAARILGEERQRMVDLDIEDQQAPLVDPEADQSDDPKARLEAEKKRLMARADARGKRIEESLSLLDGMKTPRGKALLEQGLQEMWGGFMERSKRREAEANVQRRLYDQDRGVTATESALEADPSQFENAVRDQNASLDALGMDEVTRLARKHNMLDRLSEAAARGKARIDPQGVLEQLALGEPTDPAIRALGSPQARERVRAQAEDSLEAHEADRIVKLYRSDVRQGDKALGELEGSSLPPERLDGIRRKVHSGVDLMREERQAESIDRITNLDALIQRGASPATTQREIANLYRRGALTPAQYASYMERSTASATRAAEAFAVQREIATALGQGVPLDPQNEKHRQFLASAFESDTRNVAAGSPEWQSVALAYASRARMLPGPAASWLRSAARSPDEKIATQAAEFYGSLDQTSPEAVGNVDTDTRAFLGSLSSMIEAGTKPETAFQTARANVFETRRDVVEQRRANYGKLAQDNAGALNEFIDRDFDTILSSQPGASAALSADFDKQTAQYFQKVGDIQLARELAWKDVSRVYGPTRVNGAPVVSAFPVERFGVTPEEVRKDVAAFLEQHPHEGVTADDVLVVPDGLTLRSVTDATNGRPVMPSYRLVTKDGDLLLGPDGVPVRYTLPSGDELSSRVTAAQLKARESAQLAVEEAKRRRAAIEAREWREATALVPTGKL